MYYLVQGNKISHRIFHYCNEINTPYVVQQTFHTFDTLFILIHLMYNFMSLWEGFHLDLSTFTRMGTLAHAVPNTHILFRLIIIFQRS